MRIELRIPVRLKWKLLAGVLCIVLLFGTIHLYLVKIALGRSLEEGLRMHLKTIASSLSDAAIPMVLRDDMLGLRKLLIHAREEDPLIRYIMILDPTGAPISSTFGPAGIPEGLPSVNTLSVPVDGPRYVRVEDARRLNQVFLDVAFPMGHGGGIGTLRVGIEEKEVRYTLNRIELYFLGMVILFVVIGTAGTLVLAWWFTRPIREIQAAMRSFDLTAIPPRIDVWTGDELEELAKGVEMMMKRLNEAHETMARLGTGPQERPGRS